MNLGIINPRYDAKLLVIRIILIIGNVAKFKSTDASKMEPITHDKNAYSMNMPLNLLSFCSDFRDSRANKTPLIATIIKSVIKNKAYKPVYLTSTGPCNCPILLGSVVR